VNDSTALPNFYKVSDDLYRGGQPNRDGFIGLKHGGVKTVVNLRSFHTDRFYLRGLGLNYFHIWCKAWHPEMEDVNRFLQITWMMSKDNVPVFVHCQYGADRTGVMVAAYRIVVQKWAVDKAVDEMVNGPFGFHEIWKDLLEFLERFQR
jgi:protein tyrosine phosphatase (PTP) superfamily phosphohydrolase (DUF442 family)